MKKALTLIGSILISLGFKAHASIPARKEITPRPALVKELAAKPAPLQQKGTTPPHKSAQTAKSASFKKVPLQAKSAAVHKAVPPRTTHR